MFLSDDESFAQSYRGDETLTAVSKRFTDSLGLAGQAVFTFTTAYTGVDGLKVKVSVPHEFHHVLDSYITGEEPNISVKTEMLIIIGQDIHEYAHKINGGYFLENGGYFLEKELHELDIPSFESYSEDWQKDFQQRFYHQFACPEYPTHHKMSLLVNKITELEENRAQKNHRNYSQLSMLWDENWAENIARNLFDDYYSFKENYPEAGDFLRELKCGNEINDKIYDQWLQENPAPSKEEMALTYVFYQHSNKVAEQYIKENSQKFLNASRFCDLSFEQREKFPFAALLPDISRQQLQYEANILLQKSALLSAKPFPTTTSTRNRLLRM
ncbi:MAG: hypothetical protein ACOYK8_01275 [Alphaproteobacteria bacterium]